MMGTFGFFLSTIPSDNLLDHCWRIYLTDDAVWDISNIDLTSFCKASTSSLHQPRVTSALTIHHCDTSLDHFTIISLVYSAPQLISALATRLHNTHCLQLYTLGSKARHSVVMPEELVMKFQCGLDTAWSTLHKTTQKGIQHSLHPLHKRYRINNLDLNWKCLSGVWYMDTLFLKTKSINSCTWLLFLQMATWSRHTHWQTKQVTA